MKRFFAAGAFTLLLSGMLFTLPPRAHAVLGIADVTITHDPIGWLQAAGDRIIDFGLQTLLETLKKRLLDTITDQIVSWIQNGNRDYPLFLSDFGSVFRDAANGAVGETIREIGLGDICDARLSARLVLSARQPQRFSRAASCTLTQVVGNITAFTKDFQNGSWIAYNSLAEPQNNWFGLKLLAADQTILDAQARQQKSALEAQSNGPFSSEKRCTRWRRTYIYPADGTKEEQIFVPTDAAGQDYYGMLQPPPPDIIPIPADTTLVDNWSCDDMNGTEVTTPASIAQEGANQSVFGDLDYIRNSTELGPYLGAIIDAGINRLLKEGVGFLRMKLSKTTDPNNGVDSYSGGFTPGAGLGQAGSAYTAQQNAILQQSKQTLLTQIDQALQDASADAGALPGARVALNEIQNSATLLSQAIQSCQLVYDITQDVAWVTNVIATAQTMQTALTGLEAGPTNITTTTTALGTLRAAVNGASTTAALAALNTKPIGTANTNHSQASQIIQFTETTRNEVNRRTVYAVGGTYTNPVTGAVTSVGVCTPP